MLGILELASFNTIEKFKISFVESVAERTAITISSLRNSIRTASLLKESQSQAEVMAQQEEKMRQNMEQAKETQEQAAQQAENFWNIKAGTFIGKDLKSLFPGEPEQYDSFLVSLFSPRSSKITGEKNNVKIPGGDGKIHSAQILLSISEAAEGVCYTAFISL